MTPLKHIIEQQETRTRRFDIIVDHHRRGKTVAIHADRRWLG
jgi:hypothetical protein